MGRTLPTITQQLTDTEAALARFRRTLRKGDQYILTACLQQRAGTRQPSV